jgi:hypothetical protein
MSRLARSVPHDGSPRKSDLAACARSRLVLLIHDIAASSSCDHDHSTPTQPFGQDLDVAALARNSCDRHEVVSRLDPVLFDPATGHDSPERQVVVKGDAMD